MRLCEAAIFAKWLADSIVNAAADIRLKPGLRLHGQGTANTLAGRICAEAASKLYLSIFTPTRSTVLSAIPRKLLVMAY
jgi:hypothetical protein